MRSGFPVLRLIAAGLLCGLFGPDSPGLGAAEAAGLESRSLRERSGVRGPAMFSAVPPEKSGVVTVNDYADPSVGGGAAVDPRMLTSRYQEFSVGAVGTGVAIGDYDNDGRPDIFTVSKTDSCRLFRNLGDWRFEDVTERAGVGDPGNTAAIWKQGATFADVNNDGWLDLYLCRFAAPNRLYVNRGDGTFVEEAAARGLAVSDASVVGAFCDYDRDGWLDVYVQTNLLDGTNHPGGQKDYLFRNQGDGTFVNVTEAAGIAGEAQGHSVTWWDYDDDGWPDIYVANDFAAPDVLYRNNRDGTFTNVIDAVVPHMPYSSMGADLGDINNDGLVDFLVAEMAATTHVKDQRTMASARSQSVDPADGSPAAPQYLRNALYLNTGTGRMMEAACLAGVEATDWTWSLRFEDLDNDGWLDLHVTNGMHREMHNTDLIQRLSAAQNPAERERLERTSPALAEANLAYRNLGGLRFENVSSAWGLDEKGISYGAAFGDLDGDGDLDLVYTNYRKGVTVLRNDSVAGNRVLFSLRGRRSNRCGIGATLRLETAQGIQIRQLSLARGVLSSSEPCIHFGLGNATVIKRLEVAWPSGHRQVFTDLPAGRHYTITEPAGPVAAVASPPAARMPLFTEVSRDTGLALSIKEPAIDELGQNPLLPLRQNRRGPAVAAGDLNGDGRDDLVVGGTPLDPARVLLATADGRFSAAPLPQRSGSTTAGDGPVLLFEANGDGRDDLLMTAAGVAAPPGSPEYRPRLLLNDGAGKFLPAPEGAVPAQSISAGAAAAADYDGDGRLDVFVGARVLPGLYPLAPRSALWNNQGGRLVNAPSAVASALLDAGMVTGALWSDVDQDGWPDLLLALEWGQVKCFRNDHGRGFEDWTARLGFDTGGTGWWNGLASADFNGDGRLDYVAGNLGLNTQYKATEQRPALLYFGDFAGNGAPQLVEAHYEGDRIVPWRNLRQLGSRIPSILRRFPRNDAYARATLGELLTEPRLAAAQRFAATEFRSGVFMSQAEGKFRFEPLPHQAQIAPFQGIAAGDLNGDGHADIYALHNSYSPAPVTGRFDGGLSQLLAGDGRGGFRLSPPLESNLIATGDAKALAVLDLDQDAVPDFFITRNNSTTLAYRNNTGQHGHTLRIRLRGQPWNPHAIGARVTVIMADGAVQTAETQAGAGYFSQSAPACYFGYTAGNRPVRIQVRWPGGRTSEHPVPRDATSLELPSPRD